VQTVEGAVLRPLLKGVIHGAFGWDVSREVIPTATGPRLIVDGVEDLPPVVPPGCPTPIIGAALGEQRRY
jgi:hypothetical protein